MRFMPSLLLAFFLPLAAWATSFMEQPFPETVKEAPIIVRGKVGNSSPEWGLGADGSKRIYTYYQLQVEEVLKGRTAAVSLQMREMGGEKDGMGMHVAGAAQFNRGEDVVVFLGEVNSDGSHDVRGLMMGKYTIQRDESGAEVLNGPGLGGKGNDHRVGEGQADPGGPTVWTLDALRQVIRSQGEAPSEGANSPNPQASPVSKAMASIPAAERQKQTSQAPQLQPVAPEGPGEGDASGGRTLWIVAIGFALLLVYFAIRKKRS